MNAALIRSLISSLFGLALASGSAAAKEDHAWIDRDQIRADLDPANSRFVHAERMIYPTVKESAPGLVICESNLESEEHAARHFARELRREDLQLYLLARLNGQPTPAFNGRCVNQDGEATCNIKIFTHAGKSHPRHVLVRNYVDKIDRYSSAGPWVEYVLKQVRELRGYHREDRESEFELSRTEYEAYAEIVATTRRMMQLFGVDSKRPVKILIWSPSNFVLGGRFKNLATLVSRESPVDEIMLLDARLNLVRLRIDGDEITSNRREYERTAGKP